VTGSWCRKVIPIRGSSDDDTAAAFRMAKSWCVLSTCADRQRDHRDHPLEGNLLDDEALEIILPELPNAPPAKDVLRDDELDDLELRQARPKAKPRAKAKASSKAKAKAKAKATSKRRAKAKAASEPEAATASSKGSDGDSSDKSGKSQSGSGKASTSSDSSSDSSSS